MPCVSVIMPAYNAEKTIESAVASVLSQTLTDIELVVCNDASVDGTASILSGIKDHRLVVVTNENNLGEGGARDVAIANASGRWLAPLDADDQLHPERLERMLSVVGSNESMMVFDNLLICHDVSGKMVPWRPLRGEREYKGASGKYADISFARFLVSRRLLCKLLIPTKLVRDNNIRHSNRRFAEDVEFLIDLIACGGQLRYLPEPLYLYRITPGSATGRSSDRTAMRSCLEDCLRGYEWSPKDKKAFKRKMAMLREDETLYALRDNICKGNLPQAFKCFLSYPVCIRALPFRVFQNLTYHAHRIRHGGSTRNAGQL